jgi:DNA invertase Pin-like site-specific DNA recombinase
LLYINKEVKMLIGYARVSKSDGNQVLDLQIDALLQAGINLDNIYTDKISGVKDDRPGLDNCLKALREGDTLIVYKLDRLGRNLKHLISTVEGLAARNIGFKVLSGQGVNIDTTTPAGKMIFSIFGALAEFERELIRERTVAGIQAARARGRMGGRKFGLTKAQVRLAEAAMKSRDTSVAELCKELGITRATLYKYISPTGELRDYAKRVLEK